MSLDCGRKPRQKWVEHTNSPQKGPHPDGGFKPRNFLLRSNSAHCLCWPPNNVRFFFLFSVNLLQKLWGKNILCKQLWCHAPQANYYTFDFMHHMSHLISTTTPTASYAHVQISILMTILLSWVVVFGCNLGKMCISRILLFQFYNCESVTIFFFNIYSRFLI